MQSRLRLSELLRKTYFKLTDLFLKEHLSALGSCQQKAKRLFNFKLRGMGGTNIPWWLQFDEARKSACATACKAPTFPFREDYQHEEVNEMIGVPVASSASKMSTIMTMASKTGTI